MTTSQTPMMQQYYALRDKHPGFLLFYRMGDFYEMFGDHAVTASGILGITLTRRHSGKNGDEGIPMCGVPFHAAEGYIAKLLKSGRKVALCEQTETPEEAKQKRGYKALVNREVVRLYTGGTVTEESMLQPQNNNFLLAIHRSGKGSKIISLAWLDLSTGEFFTQETSTLNLLNELIRINAEEIIITQSNAENLESELQHYDSKLTVITADNFALERASSKIQKIFNLGTLDSLGFSNDDQISTCGALLFYIEQTQTGKMPILNRPKNLRNNAFLHIDEASRKNLELIQTLQGERNGSLLNVIDHTLTGAGSRLLCSWLASPLQDLDAITKRQQAISFLKNDNMLRSELRNMLKQTSDISRAVSRLTLERGGPRDLASIRTTLRILPDIIGLFKFKGNDSLAIPQEFTQICEDLSGFASLTSILNKSLEEEDLPMLARDGGFIKSGFCAEFDKYKNLKDDGMNMLRQLEAKEAENTGISTLRIKYNKVWGYFIEVTKAQASKIPENYIHRQTTTNNQRFSTAELMQLERDYSAAEANSLAREQQLFADLVELTSKTAHKLLTAAQALARLDVLACGAELAEARNYICPQMDNSNAFDIREGRHPVVEQTVDSYVANDCQLSGNMEDGGFDAGGKLWLITGPNMAGKSTFLRQNALIAILAHMGFYVPASKAHIGIVDQIFTRIGAGDDLASGKSTFMMEMVETAAILNNATPSSLVILDEIGRGTATYDGLSIAWAAVEHILTKNKSRGLFATHYHEMVELEEKYSNLCCYHVTVKEWEGDIVFLHRVESGAAPHSYGIHVGRLAGLPKSVTRRAEQILNRLEAKAGTGKNLSTVDLPLFDAGGAFIGANSDLGTDEDNNAGNGNKTPNKPSAVEEKLLEIGLDDLSPREAQAMLYELKDML